MSAYIGNLFMCNTITLLFAILIFAIILSFRNISFYKKHIASRKWLWPLIDVFFGCILSSIYFLTFYLASTNTENNMINATAIILIILPGVFYTSPYFGVGGVATVFIGIFSLFSFSNVIIVYLVTTYLIYLVISLLIYYLLPKLSKILQTIGAHICFIVGEAILILVLSYGLNMLSVDEQKKIWITSSILQIFILLTWLLMVYVSRIYEKTQMMNIKVSHSYKHFVVANYAHYAINEFIEKENVQYAYVIGFSIKKIKKDNYVIGKRMTKTIKQHIADQIKVSFNQYDHKLLFMSDNDSFFILLKTDISITKSLKTMYANNYIKTRQKNDPLHQFDSFKVEPFSFQNVSITSQVNLLVGLYGVHNNDIFSLIYDLQSMIEWFEPKKEYNTVQLFDPKIEFTSHHDMEQFQRLKQSLNIHEIEQKNHIIKYHNHTIIFPTFNSLKLAAFNTSGIIRMTPTHLRPIMIKHLAARALQQFSISNNKNDLLMIHYPIESLSDSNFSTQIFYSKISHFDIAVNRVVLLLDLEHLNSEMSHEHIINNIVNLKKMGVRFVCNNVNVHNIDLVMLTKPFFVFYQDFSRADGKEQKYRKLMKQMLTKAKINYYVN